MRTRATVLALVAIAVSSTGCGGGGDPATTRTGARVPTTTTPAAVTPADYALRAERRCKVIVGVVRRNVIAARRYNQAPSDATLRAFSGTYRELFSVLAVQFDRFARLTPPDEYRAFQRSLERGARVFGSVSRRALRLLAGTPTVADIARVVRLLDRTPSIAGDRLPPEVARRAPSCAAIDGGAGGTGDRPRDTLAA